MAEQRPQIPYFKEFLPTLVCIVLSLFFAMVFQFNEEFSYRLYPNVERIRMYPGRCNHGRLCLLHRHANGGMDLCHVPDSNH